MSEYANEELAVQSEWELGETEKKRLEALEAVREWLGENEGLSVRFGKCSVLLLWLCRLSDTSHFFPQMMIPSCGF